MWTTRFAVGSSLDGKGELRIYQTADGKVVSRLQAESAGIYTIGYRPDGKQVASAGFDGAVRLNDAQDGKLVREFVPCPLTPEKAVRAGAK